MLQNCFVFTQNRIESQFEACSQSTPHLFDRLRRSGPTVCKAPRRSHADGPSLKKVTMEALVLKHGMEAGWICLAIEMFFIPVLLWRDQAKIEVVQGCLTSSAKWVPFDLDFQTFRLSNVSLGKSFQQNGCSVFKDGFVNFTANRIWRVGPYAVLHTILLMYPSWRMRSLVKLLVNWFRFVTSTGFAGADRNVFLVVSSETVTCHLRRESAFVREEISWHSLDFGYELFWFSGATSQVPVLFTVFPVTALVPLSYLSAKHVTPDGKVRFNGFYAACFALFPLLPKFLRLTDYFDFWARMDLDFVLGQRKSLAHQVLFPTRSLVGAKAYLFGCFEGLDHPSVAVNVFRMVGLWLTGHSKVCGLPRGPRIASVETGYLRSQRQKVPGAFHESWLGLYSSPEVLDFATFYFRYPEGWRFWRWGDQQYMLMVNALFSGSAASTVLCNCSFVLCRHHQLGEGACRQQAFSNATLEKRQYFVARQLGQAQQNITAVYHEIYGPTVSVEYGQCH